MLIHPLTRDLVLVGGGHAHALLLRRWAMSPLAGARVTLINPGPSAPYTGMLPGFVAGHYDRETLDIDLVRLARAAGARMIFGRAVAIDRATQEIEVEDALIGPRRIAYDVASLDIGIHGRIDVPGFDAHGVAAKPLGQFATRWRAFLDRGAGSGRMAVIGGGVGGAELAMAMAEGARGRGVTQAEVTLVDSGRILAGVGHRTRAALVRELRRNAVTVIEHTGVSSLTATALHLSDGHEIASDFTCAAPGARPWPWLGETGLALCEGFVRVGPTLQSVTDPAIFAVGDCAHLDWAPRPKAGVFAVRQAPVLFDNLRAALGAGTLRRYAPQRGYLKLISTGRKSAVADRGRLTLAGAWAWRWKDRIDRRFMARLSDLAPMAPPPLPKARAAGLDALSRQAPCGGCGAKVGRDTLAAALTALPRAPGRADVLRGAGDDAAVLAIGGARQVLTVDQIRPFSEDPGLMAHVAAHHALGDCLAMGAAPQAVLPILTLPRATPRIEGRILREVTAAAARVFAEAGAAIVGGHSATGPEAAYGFTVTGMLEGPEIALGGARAGDALILTHPLGTGVILAGEMALDARGDWVMAAIGVMCAPKGAAARALRAATAMTDVTGFGLAGHLAGLLEASHLAAEIDLDALPVLPGALELIARGRRSTLHAENASMAARVHLPPGPRREILFDPQTSGGFLAALAPEEVDAALDALRKAGAPAARIGTLVAGPPEIHGPRSGG